MKNYTKICYAFTALILCAQFTLDQDNASVSGKSVKPAVDFLGIITDNTGKKFKAQNITISGLYKQIPVFQKPKDMKDENYNPSINIIRLDLSEITRLHIPHPQDTYTFDNRKYLEIDVFSHDKAQTKNSYLIENSKKILCEEVNPAGPIERELQFSAIQEVLITTYTQKKQDGQDPKKQLCCTPCQDQKIPTENKNAITEQPLTLKNDKGEAPAKKSKTTKSADQQKKEKERYKKVTQRNAQKHLELLQKEKKA